MVRGGPCQFAADEERFRETWATQSHDARQPGGSAFCSCLLCEMKKQNTLYQYPIYSCKYSCMLFVASTTPPIPTHRYVVMQPVIWKAAPFFRQLRTADNGLWPGESCVNPSPTNSATKRVQPECLGDGEDGGHCRAGWRASLRPGRHDAPMKGEAACFRCGERLSKVVWMSRRIQHPSVGGPSYSQRQGALT